MITIKAGLSIAKKKKTPGISRGFMSIVFGGEFAYKVPMDAFNAAMARA